MTITPFDHAMLAQRVLFGSGLALKNTVTALAAFPAAQVLLIASSSAAAWADQLAARHPMAARIDKVARHVPADDAAAAVALARETGVGVIVSVGGGSATGLAKAIALKLQVAIVAVPTTYAGSEATAMWGITEAGRKTTGVDARVLPHTVVYDSQLLAHLPRDVAAASALNAVAHAVDSLWAPAADPVNRAFALQALHTLAPGLRTTGSASIDPDGLLFASYLAATAFASAGSGLHHKICHVLGGAYDLPHAELHAAVLPFAVAYNQVAVPDSRIVAEILQAPTAAHGLRSLAVELGTPGSLREIGMPGDRLDEAAQLCVQAVPPSNPRPVDLAAMRSLLGQAWEGVDTHLLADPPDGFVDTDAHTD